ncbi:MAG TPA: class I SAM-dependent methyltransferase [Nitrospiria bacterium]|nr:class I SAM-dependent methyltransferase [Nitrospiria bacterium]
MKKNLIDGINKKTMQASVADYSALKGLSPPEEAALAACGDCVRGRPILDLGVGAGRTVEALRAISADYIGVDYVEEMVAFCRRRFPGVRFEHADARSLTRFRDHTFALVVFACNGISMVDHAGRLAVLKTAHRLLEPGGFFIFSTYNRDNALYKTWFRFPDFSFTKNPFKLAVRSARFCVQTATRAVNRVRLKPRERQTPEYAIVNDVCHDYATMLYYISVDGQRAQLGAAGFLPRATVFDLSGREVAGDTPHDSLTYLARKPF